MTFKKSNSLDLGVESDNSSTKDKAVKFNETSDRRNTGTGPPNGIGFDGLRKRKSLAAIVPTEDKFQKLKNVRLAGFAFVARTTNWYARAFWIILILLAFAFLVYEIYRTISDFINNPIITTYVLNPKDEVVFPKIFICPTIPASAAFFAKNPKKTELLLNLLSSLQNLGTNKTTVDTTVFDMDNSTIRDGLTLQERVFQMGFTVDEFFLTCRFYGNGSAWEDVPCSNFVSPLFDHRYGKCFQVDVNRNQTSDGRGLSMLINSRSKSDSVDNKLLMKPYEGIYVTIDSQYQPASYDKNLVSTGSYIKMGLSLTHLVLQNLLSGALIQPCAENDNAQLKILKTRYTLSSCKMECILSEARNSCSCLPAIDISIVLPEILNSTKFCTFEQHKMCLIGNVSISDDSNKRISDCQNRCQSPCDDYRYEVSSSSAPLNPPAFEDRAAKIGAKVDELILLDIAFSRLETVEFTQTSSMTFDFFVGNMGAQVTLWIGGCMLTLLPLPLSFIAFLVMAFAIKIKHCFKKDEDDDD